MIRKQVFEAGNKRYADIFVQHAQYPITGFDIRKCVTQSFTFSLKFHNELIKISYQVHNKYDSHDVLSDNSGKIWSFFNLKIHLPVIKLKIDVTLQVFAIITLPNIEITSNSNSTSSRKC